MFMMDSCITDPTAPPFMFQGIPVKFSDYITKEITKRKRWSRLGRPDKVRTRTLTVPAIIVLDEAKFKSVGSDLKRTVVYMHSKLKPALLRQLNK